MLDISIVAPSYDEAPILKDLFGAKTSMVVGRKYVRLGMSQWDVRAASTRLHGGSYDFVIADEIFDSGNAGRVYYDITPKPPATIEFV